MRVKGSTPPGPTITLTADAVQATVALVTETATATAGSTIAWTLQELAPGGTWTDATASLSATSGTSVTWTPDALGYQYAVTAVATLNGQTATARRAVRCGQGQASLTWTQAGLWDFSAAATVAAPTASPESKSVAGLSFSLENGHAVTGTIRNTNTVGMEFVPGALAAQQVGLGTSTRTALLASVTMAAVGIDPDDESQDALVLWKIAAFTGVTNQDQLQVGWESDTNAISSGAAGRGELFGPSRSSAAQQFVEGGQDQGGVLGQIVATTAAPSSSSARVIAIRISGRNGQICYYSNTVGDFDLADPLTAMTKYSSGVARQRSAPPTADARLLVAVSCGSTASPVTGVIQALRVLKRAATLT